jgi:hypothetical protein
MNCPPEHRTHGNDAQGLPSLIDSLSFHTLDKCPLRERYDNQLEIQAWPTINGALALDLNTMVCESSVTAAD